jgi:hypothetical protein
VSWLDVVLVPALLLVLAITAWTLMRHHRRKERH